MVHKDGLLIVDNNGKMVCKCHLIILSIVMNYFALQLNIARLSADGKMMNACKFGSAEANLPALELTADELALSDKLKQVWKAILNIDVENDTDFFKSGAGSMDVVRYGWKIIIEYGSLLRIILFKTG